MAEAQRGFSGLRVRPPGAVQFILIVGVRTCGLRYVIINIRATIGPNRA